jgi:transcriptional regulator with XRE-family HTH domain
MSDIPLDFRRLAADLSYKMEKEDKSLRVAAEEIGTSPATLSRILKGDETDILPDTKTLLKAVSWVGRRIADYEPANQSTASSIADVEVHLRALPGLNERDKDVLVAMVRAAHDQFGTRRKKG